jgi:hypothetical protein
MLDFIIKLPLLKDLITKVKYNSILIITNRLIKYTYFILYLESLNAKDLAYTFLCNSIINYRMLETIISNQDKLFISKFWKSLMDQLCIKYKLLIAYHL